MLNRRELLGGMLRSSPLLALASSVPQFLARTALAAADATTNKEKILVVIELAGGNDGLNMLVPYGDDLYHRARGSLRIAKEEVIRIDDYLGLNPAMKPLDTLLAEKRLALVQGVGYPNPIRSHFEAMDIWHTADPTRRSRAGWLGQAIGALPVAEGKAPALNLASDKLPLALQGGSGGVMTIDPSRRLGLDLGTLDTPPRAPADPKSDAPPYSPYADPHASAAGTDSISRRERLIRELTAAAPARPGSMAEFVRHTALESFSAADRLKKIVAAVDQDARIHAGSLLARLHVVARMIDADFGARIYFVSLSGFDTHGDQRRIQDELLGDLAIGLSTFFEKLGRGGHADRALVMTFSEFGRRLHENGSRGTDHGAASTMILAGGGLKGGVIGPTPRLDDLADGDIKYHTDFRRVYATILGDWLKCDSRRVLCDAWERLPIFG